LATRPGKREKTVTKAKQYLLRRRENLRKRAGKRLAQIIAATKATRHVDLDIMPIVFRQVEQGGFDHLLLRSWGDHPVRLFAIAVNIASRRING
jgi:hypothetical protein